MIQQSFGLEYVRLSDGVPLAVQSIAEQHIQHELGGIHRWIAALRVLLCSNGCAREGEGDSFTS